MNKLTKRNFLWLVPIIIIIIYWYYYGPKDEITDNEYVTYIKEESFSPNTMNYEKAFANYCNKGKWVYFQTSKNQNVVEFKGTCPNNNEKVDINLQFIVEKKQTNYKIGALLLNGEKQTEESKNKFLQLVFNSK